MQEFIDESKGLDEENINNFIQTINVYDENASTNPLQHFDLAADINICQQYSSHIILVINYN